MSDRRITLTDVMLGVHNLGLCSKIPPAQFRFLIGLILKGNSLGFKPVMEITNGEAMAIGGGNSRQSVNRLRQSLCKFKVDDKPILKVLHGNNLKNISAKYKISYDLLWQNGSVWRGSTAYASQNNDGSNDGSNDASDPVMMTDTVTSLRSEEKREEDHTHPTVNLVTTGEGVEEKSKNGGGFVLTEEKSEEDFEKACRELGCLQVNEPARSELAAKYQTRYLFRQIAQIKKDFEKGITFRNPGGALVSRIRNGYITEDYPE